MTFTPKVPTVHQQRILDSFVRHVAVDGYDGTNFSTIAADVGVAKGTIVHHFGTKELILATMHEQYMSARTTELLEILEELEDAPSRLAGVIYSLVLAYEYHRDATVAFQREVVRLTGSPALKQGVELRRAYITKVRSVIEDGIAAGDFRENKTALRTLLLFGSAQWMWTWYRPGREFTPDGIGQELATISLLSLLNDPTRLETLVAPDGIPALTAGRILAAHART